MTKIKITEKEIEIEGSIEEGKVTPFGTSGHIASKKKHIGKKVNVILPSAPRYFWLISLKERDSLLKMAKKNIEKENNNLRHYNLKLIEELRKEEFDIDSLIKILEFVNDSKLTNKIKSLYNIK